MKLSDFIKEANRCIKSNDFIHISMDIDVNAYVFDHEIYIIDPNNHLEKDCPIKIHIELFNRE